MMRFFRVLGVMLTSAVICSLFVSCHKRSDGRSVKYDSNGEFKIGLSIDTLIIERWKQDCDVFTSTAKNYGVSVIVQDASNSVQEQIRQLEYLIDQKVDALVVIPKEADSLSEVIGKAKAKNIPVISYDRLIRNADVDLYITVDCEKVGQLMAESLLSVQKAGYWWCIYGSEADYNMTLVDSGVLKGIEKAPVTITTRYFTPDWNYDLSYQQVNGMLNQGLVPTAVVCGNDAIAEVVIRAISEHKLGTYIPVVGQDADLLACRRIADGVQTATVYKPISELAYKAAECACLLASGNGADFLADVNDHISNGSKKVPSILLDPVLVTKENLEEVVVKSGFHTAGEIFK